jgi:hypothetical protein
MSVCCSNFPKCECHLEGKMLMNPGNYRRLQEALKQPSGCILILRTGERVECYGVSVTRAKHARRTHGAIPITRMTGDRKAGERRQILGANIRQILPLFTSPNLS